jgi:uncharacterized membrane protein YbhN (UPF0104 family)
VVSAVLLGGLAWFLDLGAVLGRLGTLRAGWVGVALLLSVVQVVVSAGRWKFTAARLGIALDWGAAIREYYLATFLNQVLPGGVLGDVSRAWRHGRAPAGGKAHAANVEPPAPSEGPHTARGSGTFDARAAHAVILERASGQLVMMAVALASVMLLSRQVGGSLGGWLLWGPIGVVIVAGALAVMIVPRLSRLPAAGRLIADAHRALISGPAALVQLSTSLVVVATYLATWIAATRAVGIDSPTGTLLPLVAPILVTMLVPITVAGWGLREAGAAALWAVVGLTAADGVAVSVAYGLLVLVGSLPGGIALLATVSGERDRDRRADHRPEESGAPGA